jgi:predicted TPR repeat methyltransferase
MEYIPSKYWESRLSHCFDLTSAGYATLGLRYNQYLYRARLWALESAIQASACQFTNQHVLEVGCGTGFYTELCHQWNVASYTGIDITVISVKTLSQNYPYFQFIRADVTATAMPIKWQLDIVIVADVLFYIIDDDHFCQAITNISSHIKSGGHLIVSDSLSVFTVKTEKHHRVRSLKYYQETLIKHGLKTVHIEPIFVLLQSLLFSYRKHRCFGGYMH